MDTIKKDVENALIFIGQAQENAPRLSDLWKELGQLYDKLDSLVEAINDGDFDQAGNER